jgi:regulatory LuxR family protein
MTISSSRITPDVRDTHKQWPAAYDLESGFSGLESRRRTAARIRRLTHREPQVVNLLLEGCENTEIAKQLGIANRDSQGLLQPSLLALWYYQRHQTSQACHISLPEPGSADNFRERHPT